MSEDRAPPPAPRRDGLLLAAVALAVYALLAQHAWYKIDGQVTLLRVLRDLLPHPRHLLADQLLAAFARLIHPLGLSLYDSAVALSAVTTALAVWASHGMARGLGLPRARAILAASMVASAPAAVFYATIVEFHAPFFGLASLALATATRAGRAASLTAGAVAGLLGSAACLTHASGAILPAILTPWVVVAGWTGTRRRRVLAAAGLAGLVHGVGIFAWPTLLRAAGWLPPPVPDDAALAGLTYWSRHFDWLSAGELRHLPTTLWREWTLPFLPASCLVLWELRRGGLRLGVAAVGLAAIPYLGSAFLLMRHEDEFGAYVLPLLPPAACLAARAAPLRLLSVCLLAALVVAVMTVRRHDRWEYGQQFTRDLAALQSEGPVLLLVHRGNTEEERTERNEVDAALMHAANRDRPDFLAVEEAVLAPPLLFDRVVDDYHRLGYRVFVSRSAEAFLDSQPAGLVLRQHLAARYERESAPTACLPGTYLVPRP